MRLLFLCHAFNSLTQRLFVEMRELGHKVSVELDIHDSTTREAIELWQPDLVIAPFLKRAIPEDIWREHTCLVVHPGVPGDRGPSALDWAVLDDVPRWGVTVLQANGEMDAGDIWASAGFPMRAATKAGLYRNEVTEAAVQALRLAVERYADPGWQPLPQAGSGLPGCARPLVKTVERRVDWQVDDTATVIRKIRSADGAPGTEGCLAGRRLRLYDAHPESRLGGRPGELLARCGDAVCVATRDAAVWIGHLRDPGGVHVFKLPAARVLGDACHGLPVLEAEGADGYRDIWYEEAEDVGYLHFAFYNGAMGTGQCDRLRAAYAEARRRSTRVIVLMGGHDYWSNGMHLNLIEAASSAADESWRNINAIDDLARDIIETDTHLTVAALQGNAGAGGVFLARAADEVWARKGVVLNPHYKDMGNLYGSEYWTYLLPRYAGQENASRITRARLPMGVTEARELGLVNLAFGNDHDAFDAELRRRAASLAAAPAYAERLASKCRRRVTEEADEPLEAFRDRELDRMRLNFYGFDPSYHVARYNFVHKVPKSRTPLTIAVHRRPGVAGSRENRAQA